MSTTEYILGYVICQAAMNSLSRASNLLTSAARYFDETAELQCSLHHTDHPLTKLWQVANHEQQKLVREYEQG